MSGILPSISIKDVPETKAQKIGAVAVIGEVVLTEVANGYVSVKVPLNYQNDEGEDKTFTARWNVKPEWFDADFASTLKELDDKERIAYQINMGRNTRGLFKAVQLDDLDFDLLEGVVVGFSAGPEKRDPSRLEIKGFYTPKSK